MAKMLPTLSQIVGGKRCTNNQERSTAIRIMKRSGATDREISNVTGHVRESSLKHYDPFLMTEKSNSMAMALSNAGLKPTAERIIPPKQVVASNAGLNLLRAENEIPNKQVVVATIHQVNT